MSLPMNLPSARTVELSRTPLGAARWLALSLMLALGVLFAGGASAQASTPAEAFVQTNVEKGLAILNNKAISADKRRAEFRQFLSGLTDIRRTALFTLGAARRTASAGEVDAFVDAFRNYAFAVYEARLSAYSGQSLKVTGSYTKRAGEYVVTTELVDPSGASSDKEPIAVNFRIDQHGDKFVVLDASVVGVWLAIEERDQFTSFLAQNNDSVPALSKHLNELAKNLEKNPPANK